MRVQSLFPILTPVLTGTLVRFDSTYATSARNVTRYWRNHSPSQFERQTSRGSSRYLSSFLPYHGSHGSTIISPNHRQDRLCSLRYTSRALFAKLIEMPIRLSQSSHRFSSACPATAPQTTMQDVYNINPKVNYPWLTHIRYSLIFLPRFALQISPRLDAIYPRTQGCQTVDPKSIIPPLLDTI